MTARALAVDIGTTGIYFAHAELSDAATPTVGRLKRDKRGIAPSWRTGGAVYRTPPPATAILADLHRGIREAGDTVAALVEVGGPDRSGVLPAAGRIAQEMVGRLGQRAGGRLAQGASDRLLRMAAPDWVSEAGLPQPVAIGKPAAAAGQIDDVIGEGERVLVIDIGAVSATLGLVSRVGGRFEQLGRALDVPAGGGDRVDAHIADLARRAAESRLDVLGPHDPAGLEAFFDSVRAAKRALADATPATVSAVVNGEAVDVQIHRQWLEGQMAADLALVAAPARQFLAAGARVVLLVGGGAKLPFVAEYLTGALGRELTLGPQNGLATVALKQLLATPPTTVAGPAAGATRGRTGAGAAATAGRARQAPAGWTLAIDFGTTYTVTVVGGSDGTRRVLDVEGNGTTTKMPSSVVRNDDGQLVVGRAADNEAVLHPTGYESAPKRRIGNKHVLLDGEPVAVVDLIAAVLRRCGDFARAQQHGTAPAVVRLTHPATWDGDRLDKLRAAAQAAGLGTPELIQEPVAAAQLLPESVAEQGKPIAIYDFGGGTFDAAVLLPTAEGFEVMGPPDGCELIGGEDIDNQIIEFLGRGPLGQRPEWETLMTSQEPAWQVRRRDLRSRVRDAKEALAHQAVTDIWIDALQEPHQLTRVQLEERADPLVKQTVSKLEETIAAAGVSAQDLGGIYLIGGSSRLPLVREKILQQLGIEPYLLPGVDPKTVVAEGAAAFTPPQPPPPAHRPRLGADPAPRAGLTYRVEHRLSMEGGAVVVQSVPHRWSSLDAFVIDEQQRAIARGAQLGPADYGNALGADGAVLIPTSTPDGQQYWSSYHIVGHWAIQGRWPQGRDVNAIRIVADSAQWLPAQPPLEFVHNDGAEPDESLTVLTKLGGVAAGTVTTQATTVPVPEVDHAKWEQLFLLKLSQQRPGIQIPAPPEPATFTHGLPCRVASYRYHSRRGRCWYGIVNGRGVTITVEAPIRLPAGTANMLRDAITIFDLRDAITIFD